MHQTKRNSVLSSKDIQMIHWNLMDLLMGVHISIIVVSDWMYRDRYFSIREEWTASLTCRMSSLLASVSYQATALLVCCVTVHSLCTACPHRVRFHLTARSSLLLCSLVWTVAVVISVVPFLLPEWKFHGHTDTCLAVLTTISEGSGKVYALALQIVLHVALGLLGMGAQGLLHWLYYFHDIPDASVTQRFLQMTDATSASSQVLLDCVRRLVFCVVSMLVHGGVTVPERVQVSFTILVLPVSAALNPVLYIINILRVRRRRRTLERVLQRLQRQLALHKPV
ncbi:relaxin receptor 2-like [Babylonia areolata]|uniref:relaxin receptor 2-like n=1 Tax=Babylonia areolata TaxID=304850 RepID=UPI003FD4A15B